MSRKKVTKTEDFLNLMTEIYDGWKDVRDYDTDHLYYDRTKWISKGISDEWWEYPNDHHRDGDLESLCVMIEQFLRYSMIVKETKIGMFPKVDGIDDEDYLIGDEKMNITEKEKERNESLTNYLLFRE